MPTETSAFPAAFTRVAAVQDVLTPDSPESDENQPSTEVCSCPFDRVRIYDRALAGLRRHLLPLLRKDLHGVAARTGLPAETLRKRRRDLERGTRSLPGVDTLAAITAAYDWSLDALLDGESESPARRDEAPAAPPAVAPLLRAHVRHVVSSAVRRAKPWAIDAVLGTDPDALLEQFECEAIMRVRALIAERERQQQLECEEDWRIAKVGLAGYNAVDCVAVDEALAPWAEILVGRIQHAVDQGRWNFMEGRFVFPSIAVRASDPWDLARGFSPAIQHLTNLTGTRIGDALTLWFEVTDAEVDAARDALARPVGRGAGLRACTLDEVLEAYEHFRRQRRCPPNAPRSLAAVGDAVPAARQGMVYDTWALNDLFAAFCTHVGLVWHSETRAFTLAPAGSGSFDDRLAPHPRHDRLIVVEWGVEYWKASPGQGSGGA